MTFFEILPPNFITSDVTAKGLQGAEGFRVSSICVRITMVYLSHTPAFEKSVTHYVLWILEAQPLKSPNLNFGLFTRLELPTSRVLSVLSGK